MKNFLVVVALFLSLNLQGADWLESLGFGSKSTNKASPLSLGGATLSQDQVAQGLKEALSKGVQHAISQLGHDDGFLTNLNVRIPMPEKLQTAEKTLRALGQSKLADDFVGSMNHAAEKAVPEAAAVFGEAIKQMSVADAKAILAGTNNAATEYFRKTTQTNLFTRFLPIVQKATEQVGVTAKYKQLVGKAGSAQTFGGLFGSKSAAAPEALDLDAYVTHGAMSGLFKLVAEEEKRIRENPLARTSDLLKKVFGSGTK